MCFFYFYTNPIKNNLKGEIQLKKSTEEFIGKVAAVSDASNADSIIGYLTWYSIGDALYDRDDLRSKLLAAGINENFLPKEIRPSDAYRRATTAVERKKFRQNETDKEYKNYIIRDVVTRGEKLQRNIVVETVNQEGERLDYETEGAKMYFDKKSNQFTFDAKDDHAEELAEEAQKLFEKYLKAHNGATVRGSVVQYMNNLSPTPVRPSGGVYFVPIKYESNLRSLVSYVSSFEKGEAHMIPLVNDDENRSLIRNKVKEHLEKIISQCRIAIRDDGGLQKGQMRALIEEAKRTVIQFRDYKELLSDTIADLDSSVELVRNSIHELLVKVSD